ncbi:hypothetical protein HELRODRAFT_155823 [Helobdella robusta]|uniref:LIM zinc-binding domain-containing protein n=1 Tax=Helobdella robusta TaxID=6412 RepID=T1ELM8_HELRO|nr:hypothetical protein HELRODRAFT_155823 [Helobdella robusta]ESO02442.1 hypothetical protein HELRODRAFT_155823 [Helobdella robusta]
MKKRILLATDYIKTLELGWASGQFVCNHCQVNLSGHRYILHDDKSFCKKCYEKLFANICSKCKTPITCEFKDLSCKNKHWHDKCFRCSGCLASLVEKPFAYKEHQLYCASCYENRAGMKKYEYKGRQWHAECFCCKVCQKLIGTNSFVPRADDIVCVPCYEKQLGQNCPRCQQMVKRGGIIYKNTTWHRDCFQCSHCKESLANKRYTSIDQRPFCVECYGALYAKKCKECKKPITGLDDAAFIAFDQQHWHKDCFKCSKCGTCLYGRGFMTEEGNVMCPECCKEV